MLMLDDLDPDGIKIIVDWNSMVINASVFIPCINTKKTITECKRIFELKSWGIETRILIEDCKLGVRIWRTY
jgi:hypothetical protein